MEESDFTDDKQNTKPWLYKKGQSGNPAGRPKGSLSLKTYLRQRFEAMTDEEREAFLDGIPKDKMWEMVEGRASQSIDHTTAGKELPVPIINLNNLNGILANNRNQEGDGDEPSNTSNTGGNLSE
jgi:hypothetical protein